MGPSNELLRQWVGKSALLGMEALDHWHHHANERVIATELKKLDPAAKRALAKKLLQEAEQVIRIRLALFCARELTGFPERCAAATSERFSGL